uniref:Uncharacterized protein n=1 Tax=Amphiprion percula TaxID=161767 RepID=A0A3P8S241_AMPPE
GLYNYKRCSNQPSGLPGSCVPIGCPGGCVPIGCPGGCVPIGCPGGCVPIGCPGGCVPIGCPGGSLVLSGTPEQLSAPPCGLVRFSVTVLQRNLQQKRL